MKRRTKRLLVTVLFVLGGALAGFLYYQFVGCSTGSCWITSHPAVTTVYCSIIGGLVSRLFDWGCGGSCNM